MEKILTVSIAAYNVDAYLEKTLHSFVVPEIMDYIEVIIVNDGSKDATLGIAQHYVDMYPNVYKIVDKENGGWGSTVNASIRIATGKYFKILDGDDWFDSRNLMEFIRFLMQSEDDMIVTQYTLFYEGSDKEELVEQDYPYNTVLDASCINKACMHAQTVKTQILQENNVQLLEHCFYTDIEFFTRAVQYVHTFQSLPLNIYCYRVGREGQSVSPSSYVKHMDEHEKVMQTVLSICAKDKKLEKLYDFLLVLAAYHVVLLTYMPPNKENLKKFIQYRNFIKKNYPLAKKHFSIKTRLVFAFPKFFYKTACRHMRRKYKL